MRPSTSSGSFGHGETFTYQLHVCTESLEDTYVDVLDNELAVD